MINTKSRMFLQIACTGWSVLTILLAQAGTVAYWPMEMNPATGGTSRKITDASGNGYDLDVKLDDAQAVNTSDVAFSRPPNGPADVTASNCAEINNGTTLTTAPFMRGTGNKTQTTDPLVLATGLRHDFTVEGYMYVKSLKHGTAADTIIAFSGVNGTGDWLWNLTEPTANSNTRQVKVLIRSGNNLFGSGILATIDDSEILGSWHHYALVFKFDEANSRSRWTFYLDGVNRGSQMMNNHDASDNVQHDRFLIGGADSGDKKVVNARFAFWRVSDKALMPSEFLRGPVVPAGAFVWKGAQDSAEWSTGSAPNWTADGVSVIWSDAKDAYFDDSAATNRIEISGKVTPASINVIADSSQKLSFSKARLSAIGAGCTNFVKRGFGTFTIATSDGCAGFQGACPIEVREGCLKVDAANANGALGDASRGYEVKVYEHATLSLYARNEIGSATPDVANDSVFTVYTNGTFDMSHGSISSDFNIQALGALDILGGNFIAPKKCHNLGYLLIRNRLTLGCNPKNSPYVFPTVLVDNITNNVGITIGRNTEFRVEDVTGDAASDGIFNCAVLARDRDSWQTAQYPCGFRKTGSGTMELNNPYRGENGSHAKPKGVIAVEAGELKVNIDYSTASKYTVAGGAFLSGTGKVSNVEFAAGAGLRVDATKADVLELAGADFAGGGVIELSGVDPAAIKNLRVVCAKVGDPVTGAANLSGWTVKIDGVEQPRVAVRVHGGFLKASVTKGICVSFF